MQLGRMAALAVVSVLLLTATPAQPDWLETSKQPGALPPPVAEEWLDAFPNLKAIAAASDGRLVAVGDSGAVFVSDTDVAQRWTRIQSNTTSTLQALVLDPVSQRIVAVGDNGTAIVAEVDPAKPWSAIKTRSLSHLTAITADPKSRRLIAVGSTGEILVGDADPKRPWGIIRSSTKSTLVAISTIGDHMVAVGANGEVLVSHDDILSPWNLLNLNIPTRAVAADPKSGHVILVGDDGTIGTASPDPDGSSGGSSSGSSETLMAVIADSRSGRIVAVGTNGIVRVSDAGSESQWHVINANTDANLISITADPISGRLVAFGESGEILVSDARGPEKPWKLARQVSPNPALRAAIFDPKSSSLIAVGDARSIFASDKELTAPWKRFDGGHDVSVAAVLASPKGGRAVAIGNDGNVLISGTDFSRPWERLQNGVKADLHAFAADASGDRMVAVGDSGTVLVVGIDPTPTGKLANSNTDAGLRAIAAAPDGRHLVAVGDRGTVLVSDADPTAPWKPIGGEMDIALFAVAGEADRGRMAAVGEAGKVLVSDSDLEKWKEVEATEYNDLNAVIADPGTHRFVAVGDFGTILVSQDKLDDPWVPISSTVPDSLRAIAVEPRYGRLIAVGDRGVILVGNTDPTEPWMQVRNPSDEDLRAIAVDQKNGRLLALGGKVIVQSVDGGLNWSAFGTTAPMSLTSLAGIAASDRDPTWLAMGEDGAIQIEKADTKTAATAADRYQIGVAPPGDKPAKRASARIEWKYPVGSTVNCTQLLHWKEDTDTTTPIPQVWQPVGVDVLQTDLGYQVDWKPQAFLKPGTIIRYAVDCWDKRVGISWVQELPTPQEWNPVPQVPLWERVWLWLSARTGLEIAGIAAAAVAAGWTLVVLLLFWRKPVVLVAWHERMPEPALDQAANVVEKISSGAVAFAVWFMRNLLLLLATTPRALDSWVADKVEAAREQFDAQRTVSDRQIALELPVKIAGKASSGSWGDIERLILKKPPVAILVSGPGGAGKTTIVCRIAGRMLDGVNGQAQGPRHMLPLLIEADLPVSATQPDGLGQHLAGVLRTLVKEGRPISLRLTSALLRNGRILVIIDGLSERSPSTCEAFNPDSSTFDIARLIATSRDPMMPGKPTLIETESIQPGSLYDFIDRYLKEMEEQKVGVRPKKEAIFRACADLTALLRKQPCTPLLASMWAREIGAPSLDLEKPRGVADLFDRYVRRLLLPAVGGDEAAVRQLTKDLAVIAEAELGENLLPGLLQRAEAFDALTKRDPSEPGRRLDILSTSRIIDSPSQDSDKVRVVPDPLAEHLVAVLRIERLRDDHKAWASFLAELRRRKPAGFVQALANCAEDEVYSRSIPPDIREKIEKLAEKLAKELAQAKQDEDDDPSDPSTSSF